MQITPFIVNKSFDLKWFIFPFFVSTGFVFCYEYLFSSANKSEIPLPFWILFILFVDVSHVYATLYRVYFNIRELKRRYFMYISIPAFSYTAALLLYTYSDSVFWRVLAYLALYHFIKQHWGFIAIYKMKANEKKGWYFDKSILLIGTLTPVLFWHMHIPRNFAWFRTNDFMKIPFHETILFGIWYLYGTAGIFYLLKSFYRVMSEKTWNPGKDLSMAGVWLTWYTGIVFFNSDTAFSITNVFIHGISYMALVWYTRYSGFDMKQKKYSVFYKKISLFLVVLFIAAFFEEFLWDVFIWKEKPEIFSKLGHWFHTPVWIKQIIIPALSVPQITHYILDGRIWKIKNNPDLIPYIQK